MKMRKVTGARCSARSSKEREREREQEATKRGVPQHARKSSEIEKMMTSVCVCVRLKN